MSPTAMFVVIWSLLVLPILGQDIGHVNEMSNFRYNCSTPDLAGSILTSPCQDLCSFCSSFYVSSIDLNKCIAYDGEDSLIPKLNGNYGEQCQNCYTNFAEPDVLYCQCTSLDGQTHDVSLDLNQAIGTRCGRLSCQGYTEALGPPLAALDGANCEVQSNIPSGNKRAAEPTASAAPELLYVRRGLLYRQFPTNSTTAPHGSGTVSVIITLTVEAEGPADTAVAHGV